MNKTDLIKYIIDTPFNTNPVILNSILDDVIAANMPPATEELVKAYSDSVLPTENIGQVIFKDNDTLGWAAPDELTEIEENTELRFPLSFSYDSYTQAAIKTYNSTYETNNMYVEFNVLSSTEKFNSEKEITLQAQLCPVYSSLENVNTDLGTTYDSNDIMENVFITNATPIYNYLIFFRIKGGSGDNYYPTTKENNLIPVQIFYCFEELTCSYFDMDFTFPAGYSIWYMDDLTVPTSMPIISCNNLNEYFTITTENENVSIHPSQCPEALEIELLKSINIQKNIIPKGFYKYSTDKYTQINSLDSLISEISS